MLAQNFKTAADLGISEAEQSALIKVLGMLERDELEYLPANITPQIPNGFNMQKIGRKYNCGTAACILGWCRIVGGEELFNDANNYVKATSQAFELFMFGDSRRGSVTPAQAAQALRSYLTTGAPDWAEALSALHSNARGRSLADK